MRLSGTTKAGFEIATLTFSRLMDGLISRYLIFIAMMDGSLSILTWVIGRASRTSATTPDITRPSSTLDTPRDIFSVTIGRMIGLMMRRKSKLGKVVASISCLPACLRRLRPRVVISTCNGNVRWSRRSARLPIGRLCIDRSRATNRRALCPIAFTRPAPKTFFRRSTALVALSRCILMPRSMRWPMDCHSLRAKDWRARPVLGSSPIYSSQISRTTLIAIGSCGRLATAIGHGTKSRTERCSINTWRMGCCHASQRSEVLEKYKGAAERVR